MQLTVSDVPIRIELTTPSAEWEGIDATEYGRHTIKVPGLYLIALDASIYHAQADPDTDAYVMFYINGEYSGYRRAISLIGNLALNIPFTLMAVKDLNVGDYIEMYIVTGSATPSTITLSDVHFMTVSL